MSEFPSRIFSGVQPTGQLHLGNYLGAIIQFVELQHRMPSIYCIVDWHAMTVYQEPETLAGAVRQVASTYLAAGIDPGKAIIFKQSNIAELCELAWLFMCVARMGWLSRMTQFKEKVGNNRDNASLGLFAYPALMAADILLYRATHVPVGDDQRQHLELTRSIAQKFNHDYQDRICALGLGVADGEQPSGNGEGLQKYFPLTETVTDGRAPRVMSLRDASRKMSKSDPSDLSRIGLLDTEDEIRTKIRKAKTDPLPLPDNEGALDERPEASNLLGIYAALAGTDRQAVLSEFAGADFSNFKSKLADLAIAELQPIRQEIVRLMNDPAHVDAVLEEGAERARAIARPVINEVKSICGLNG